MTSVVSLHAFANSANVLVVVLVDMPQKYPAYPRLLAISEVDRALDNCLKVLYHSRQIRLPVVFVRMVGEIVVFNRATPFVPWIEGLEPYRNEMVFERASPLCYCSFAALVNQSPRQHHAGRIGGRGRLSVDLDRWVPSKPQGRLAVRCVSQPRAPENVVEEVHHAVSTISEVYAVVYETAERIAATAPRRIGNGKGAGG